MSKKVPTAISSLELLAETVLVYLHWTTFTMLIPTIWFAPMDKMAATDAGEEFFYLVAYLGPLLLAVPPIRRFIIEHNTLTYLLSLVGLPSYFLSTLGQRSMSVAAGCGIGLLVHTAHFWASPTRRERAIAAHFLALIALVATRMAMLTLWPVWMNEIHTYCAIGIGVVAALYLSSDSALRERLHDPFIRPNTTILRDIFAGISYGSLLFSIHWVLTSHGVMARWIEINPYPLGAGLVGAMIIGFLIGYIESVTRSWLWYIVGTAAPIALIQLHTSGWPLVFVVALYLSSIWRVTVIELSETRAFVSFSVACLFYVLGHLAVIWSVAWCFVPEGTGGPFMRDRAYQAFYIFVALAGLISKRASDSNSQSKQTSYGAIILVTLLVLAAIVVPSIYHRHSYAVEPAGYGVQTDHPRAMAWAIRFGYNNRGWPNFREVAELAGANVIGLVETDTTRPFNANWDIVEYLSARLSMYSDYGPPTTTESWGCALLSVYPIVRSWRSVMPSPDGETACFIDATLNVNGKEVDVIVSHFGNTQHYRDRALQAQFSAERISGKPKSTPLLWLGYLTDRPGGSSYKALMNAGLVDASPGEDRYCLYLMHRHMSVSNFSRIDVGVISDTEIQIADFRFR